MVSRNQTLNHSALVEELCVSMPVPLNDPKRRFTAVQEQAVEQFTKFLKRGVYVGGEDVRAFEEGFAVWLDRQFCVAVANGTDALELAARAVGVGVNDEVICVANAGGYFTAVCSAIGALPVYVDVNLADAQINLDAAVAGLTDRTGAIVVTHLFGLLNDVSLLKKKLSICGRSDIKIIEDFAQAHGAKVPSGYPGGRGDVAAFSFYPTKNLGAMGDAGAVATDNPETAAAIRQLREYGWASKYLNEMRHGRNSRMDGLQAVLLSQALGTVAESNRIRRNIFRRYTQCLPPQWRLIGEDSERFVAHLCVLVAPNIEARDRMARHLHASEIANTVHYPLLDVDQPAWTGFGRRADSLQNSYQLLDRILTIPCFPEMYEGEIVAVMAALTNFKS